CRCIAWTTGTSPVVTEGRTALAASRSPLNPLRLFQLRAQLQPFFLDGFEVTAEPRLVLAQRDQPVRRPVIDRRIGQLRLDLVDLGLESADLVFGIADGLLERGQFRPPRRRLLLAGLARAGSPAALAVLVGGDVALVAVAVLVQFADRPA